MSNMKYAIKSPTAAKIIATSSCPYHFIFRDAAKLKPMERKISDASGSNTWKKGWIWTYPKSHITRYNAVNHPSTVFMAYEPAGCLRNPTGIKKNSIIEKNENHIK